MSFSDKQVNALRRDLNASHVRTREVQGRKLSYIKGWHAIAEANRIFGFDGWDRETIESKCLLARESRGTLHAVYLAKVRITVRAEGGTIVREGYGTGESQGQSVGDAHDRAVKTAETDATKRALATFGKPFGLALYLSARNGRDHQPTYNPNEALPIPDHARRRTLQRLGANGRYYVPSRPTTVIDAELRQVAGETKSMAEPSAQPSPTGLISGGASNESTKDAETIEVKTGSPSPQTETATSEAQPDRSGLLIDWPKRHREPAHLRFVAAQPCLFCGRTPSDAHHLRFAQTRALGRKVSDEFTVPLCRTHHRQLHHSGNEVKWWQAMDRDVDPLEIAKGLWEQSRGGPQAMATLRPDTSPAT